MRSIRIGFALGASLGGLVLLVALAYGWVAIYSHWIHPDEDLAFYQAYARVASPWVSVLAGVPIFWGIGALARARLGQASRATSLVAYAIYASLSVGVTAVAGSLVEIAGMELLSLATKLAALLVGVGISGGVLRPSSTT
jgi:hypothetical protein